MKKITLLIFMFFSFTVMAKGGQEGGGGGVVHDTFIQYGKEVLYFLKYNPKGQEIVKRRKLDLCRLKATLNENLIFVYSSAEMVDHRGSVVDAYTYDWAIYIKGSVWDNYISNELDVYHLVFKEMLRSEGTYFYKAIDISLELKRLSAEFKKQRSSLWIKFLAWFENNESNQCLNENDKVTIETNLNEHILLNEYEVPSCKTKLSENNQYHASEFLINSANSTKCSPVPSKCKVLKIRRQEGNNLMIGKAIYWKGSLIYHVPIAIKDTRTNENTFEYPFMSILNETIQFKLDDLYYAGICSNTPIKNARIPEFIRIRKNELYGTMQPNEILREDNFLDCPFCKKPNAKVIGIGSKLQIIGHNLKTHDYLKAKFVKVRLLENTLRQRPGYGIAAKSGTEGWIGLSSTKLMYYYNAEFDMLMDRD